MEGQEYLNQISAEARPVKKSGGGGIFSSKIFMAILIGVVALVIIIVLGSVLTGGKGGDKKLSTMLLLHIDNTAGVIQEYQPKVKSSDLRSSSASLYSVLSNTSRELTDYMTEKYDYKDKDIDKTLVSDAELARDGLESDLFNAKINGTLDRIYALKMAHEISMITAEETKIINSTSNETLSQILTTSYNSLKNLEDKFNDFSETK